MRYDKVRKDTDYNRYPPVVLKPKGSVRSRWDRFCWWLCDQFPNRWWFGRMKSTEDPSALSRGMAVIWCVVIMAVIFYVVSR